MNKTTRRIILSGMGCLSILGGAAIAYGQMPTPIVFAAPAASQPKTVWTNDGAVTRTLAGRTIWTNKGALK